MDAQQNTAKEERFETWEQYAQFKEELAKPGSPVAQFEAAVDAIVQGDIDTLAGLLRANPDLIKMRSLRDHHAALIHYVGANGVEQYRQRSPANAVAVLQVLLDAGADVNAIADMYHGATPLGLVATSCHPAIAGVMFPLLTALLQAGADIEFSRAGGNNQTAVNASLHNGRPESADFLARHGAKLDLEGACGVGRLDIVQSFFKEDGTLKSTATQSQLEYGFMWASGYGHIAVVEYLLQKGVNINMEVGGFCPIHYAIMGEHLDIIRLLIEHGASLEIENMYGGTALGCALWRIANPDYYIERSPEQVAATEVAMFETLLAAGAVVDPGMLPWLHEQKKVSSAIKARIEQLFHRYGA
jgi:hypothetical protein